MTTGELISAFHAAALMRAELQRLEWLGDYRCPSCLARSVEGHRERCTLAAALRAADLAEAVERNPDLLPIAGSAVA